MTKLWEKIKLVFGVALIFLVLFVEAWKERKCLFRKGGNTRK